MVPCGRVVDEWVEPVTFKFVSVLDLTRGLHEGGAHPTPRGVSVGVAVDAVKHAGRAIAGGVVLSTSPTNVDVPLAFARKVAGFDSLTA